MALCLSVGLRPVTEEDELFGRLFETNEPKFQLAHLSLGLLPLN